MRIQWERDSTCRQHPALMSIIKSGQKRLQFYIQFQSALGSDSSQQVHLIYLFLNSFWLPYSENLMPCLQHTVSQHKIKMTVLSPAEQLIQLNKNVWNFHITHARRNQKVSNDLFNTAELNTQKSHQHFVLKNIKLPHVECICIFLKTVFSSKLPLFEKHNTDFHRVITYPVIIFNLTPVMVSNIWVSKLFLRTKI